MSNNQNTIKGFYNKHKILSNIILIIIVDCLLIAISYFGLSIFTNHYSHRTVPNLHGLSADEALSILEKQNLQLEINDSTYIEGVEPGSIIEQNPKAGSNVKDNRIIYVTIRTYSTKLIKLPTLTDISLRQAESLLRSSGIKNIRTQSIPSEYADLVYDVKWNGSSLQTGDKVPVNATITLFVGDGSLGSYTEELYGDSTLDEYPTFEEEF